MVAVSLSKRMLFIEIMRESNKCIPAFWVCVCVCEDNDGNVLKVTCGANGPTLCMPL